MLEIKNLVKVYKTKDGSEVRAVDDVSISFEEKGMIFLLGKSGSGKSTLLNLCGGLDSPDSGEIIIKGRSSKDFTRSDFDSYRNTFVGFVFQEYNILDEFSVEDNIALALELQGKNKDKQAVREILSKVDLDGFASRKPNTLSGGQKQRIAIARALVKNPEIILADEPTGALDSTTGKQIFDTLKKLSEEKLVVIVSHDREFAEQYADRIIELKDGKIISDVTKTVIQEDDKVANVEVSDDDTITVKDGAKLTDEDFNLIKEFLTTASENTSKGRSKKIKLRKSSALSGEGKAAVFCATEKSDAPQRTYTAEESRFIRSKLPMKHALKIGASGLKVKPFRLFFTILLSLIAFTMFGLFSTLTFYNARSVAASTYKASDYQRFFVGKNYNADIITYYHGEEDYRYTTSKPTRFTSEEIDSLKEKYGGGYAAFNYEGESVNPNSVTWFSVANVISTNSAYYFPVVSAFIEAGEGSSFELLTDTDMNALGKNGAVIPSYLFDSLAASNWTDPVYGKKYIVSDYNDAVGKYIYISSSSGTGIIEVKVMGVYRCDPPEKYSKLKNDPSAEESALFQELSSEQRMGFYNAVLVSPEFYDANYEAATLNLNYHPDFTNLSGGFRIENADSENGETIISESISLAGKFTESSEAPGYVFYVGGDKTSLADDEILLPFSAVEDYLISVAEEKAEGAPEGFLNDCKKYLGILSSGMIEKNGYSLYAGKDLLSEALSFLKENLAIDKISYPDVIIASDTVSNLYEKSFKIAGFYYGKDSICALNSVIFGKGIYEDLINKYAVNPDEGGGYINKEETSYIEPANAKYNLFIIDYSDKIAEKLANTEKITDENNAFIKVISPISDKVETATTLVNGLSKIFLWSGVVMAVFSVLLLFNFISVSISGKKKEIGILRALGARSVDVFKIFFSESLMISAACFLLSIMACFALCPILNNAIAKILGISLFVFGPLSVLILLAIALGTSLIATFLPVYLTARKKPVESIRAL